MKMPYVGGGGSTTEHDRRKREAALLAAAERAARRMADMWHTSMLEAAQETPNMTMEEAYAISQANPDLFAIDTAAIEQQAVDGER